MSEAWAEETSNPAPRVTHFLQQDHTLFNKSTLLILPPLLGPFSFSLSLFLIFHFLSNNHRMCIEIIHYLWEFLLSFQHVGLRDRTCVIRFSLIPESFYDIYYINMLKFLSGLMSFPIFLPGVFALIIKLLKYRINQFK